MPNMGLYMENRISRRGVLKALGISGATVASLPVLTDSGSAWEDIPISLSCPDCQKLGKVEAEGYDDDAITGWKVDEDFGSSGTATDTTFTFDTDEDGTEETTVKLTKFYFENDEKVGFDVLTDAGLCRVDVKDGGGTVENEYTDLGSIVAGTEFFAPDNDDPDDQPNQISFIEFYYCPEPRVSVLSETVKFDPVKRIDVTEDDVRIAVWYGPRHYDDSYLFDNGTKPTQRLVGDRTGDGVDDLCFDFDFSKALINDPFSVGDGHKFSVSLLVEETDGDKDTFVGNTQEGILATSPDTS